MKSWSVIADKIAADYNIHGTFTITHPFVYLFYNLLAYLIMQDEVVNSVVKDGTIISIRISIRIRGLKRKVIIIQVRMHTYILTLLLPRAHYVRCAQRIR